MPKVVEQMPMSFKPEYKRWDRLSHTERHNLANAILACPCIKDTTARETILKQLPKEIQFSRAKDVRQDIDIQNLVDVCSSYHGGIESLIDVICSYDGGTWQVKELYVTMQELYPLPVPWTDLAELKFLLTQVQVSDTVLFHCCSSFSKTMTLPISYIEDNRLNDIVDYLANKGRITNKSAPILTFLIRLVPNISQSTLKHKFRDWIEKIAKHLQVDIPAIHKDNNIYTSQGPTNLYLLVKIEPYKWDENMFYVRGWLFINGSVVNLSLDEELHTLPHIPSLLDQLIKESYNPIRDGTHTKLIIEFLLPRTLLCHSVDQWEIKVGMNLKEAVGSRYQVSVRSLERIYNDDMRRTWDLWYKRWSHYTPLQKAARAHFLFPQEEECKGKKKTYSLLRTHGNTYLIMFDFVPPQTSEPDEDILLEMLNAGIPIAIWFRQHCYDSATLLKKFKKTLSTKPLESLLDLVQEKRLEGIASGEETHIGRHLTLLWDDPNRLPPDVMSSYSAPKA